MAELKIVGVSSHGTEFTFHNILEFSFQSDRFTPADSFSFSSLDQNIPARIMKVKVYLHKKLLSSTIVDVQKTICDSIGIKTSFFCRNKTALMLDNEVTPRMYQNLSAVQLIESHGKQFGLTGYRFPSNPVLKQILARKGFSHWEFISLFCKIAFGKSPFVDRTGKISLSPFSSSKFRFGEKDDIPFSKATIKEDRYNMISSLHIQTDISDTGPQYNKLINNKIAQTIGVTRERFYRPGTEWGGDLWLSGANLIREKQLDYFEIELICPGLLDVRVGDLATFNSKLASYNNLYIAQVNLSFLDNSFSTKVKLWDKLACD